MVSTLEKQRIREAKEELGIDIVIEDPKGETGESFGDDDGAYIREEIFTDDGINWISFTYKCHADIEYEEITLSKMRSRKRCGSISLMQ